LIIYLVREGEEKSGAREKAHNKIMQAPRGLGGRIESEDDGEGECGKDGVAIGLKKRVSRDGHRIDVVLTERPAHQSHGLDLKA